MPAKKPEPSPRDKQLLIRIPEDLHRQLKASAALEGRSVVDVVELMIRDYVRSVKAGRKV